MRGGWTAPGSWIPTALLEYVRTIGTSTLPAIVRTDSADAVLKHPANPQGPTTLANEWVARRLAADFGMRVFDAAIFPYAGDLDIPLKEGNAGPALCYLTRFRSGRAWSGDPAGLDELDDPGDLTRLVLLDTWLRNRDRFFPGRRQSQSNLQFQSNLANVFLAESARNADERTLVAMDFSHAFTRTGEWTLALRNPSATADANLYGLFPAFAPHWNARVVAEARAFWRALTRERVAAILAEVPTEWIPDPGTPAALADYLLARAAYLARIEPGDWERRMERTR